MTDELWAALQGVDITAQIWDACEKLRERAERILAEGDIPPQYIELAVLMITMCNEVDRMLNRHVRHERGGVFFCAMDPGYFWPCPDMIDLAAMFGVGKE